MADADATDADATDADATDADATDADSLAIHSPRASGRRDANERAD